MPSDVISNRNILTNTIKRILLADEDSKSAEKLAKQLESIGYKIVALLSDGESVIESAEELKPDIILLNATLSGEIDGIDAAKKISSQFDIPIVFMISSIKIMPLILGQPILSSRALEVIIVRKPHFFWA